MPQLINLIGKKFGKWTVLYNNKDRLRVNVRCVCGYTAAILRVSLRNGTSRSCLKCSYGSRQTQLEIGKVYNGKSILKDNGKYVKVKCLRCKNVYDIIRALVKRKKAITCNKCKNIKYIFNHNLELSQLLNARYRSLYYGVGQKTSIGKRKNLKFSLSKKQAFLLMCKPCHYCGGFDEQFKAGKYKIPSVGIDRVDSNLGYKLNNCVPCCSICNTLKLDHKVEDFFNIIKKIYKHNKLKKK